MSLLIKELYVDNETFDSGETFYISYSSDTIKVGGIVTNEQTFRFLKTDSGCEFHGMSVEEFRSNRYYDLARSLEVTE